MNKQEFEEKIERTSEDAAAHMEERIDKAMIKAEQKIEMATDRFDKSVNRAAKTQPGNRLIFFVNLLIAFALFIGGFVLLHCRDGGSYIVYRSALCRDTTTDAASTDRQNHGVCHDRI